MEKANVENVGITLVFPYAGVSGGRDGKTPEKSGKLV